MTPSTERISFDTGALLKAYCYKKRIHKAALSRHSGIGYQQLLKFMKAKTMDINKLVVISYVLNHNFLLDLASQLPITLTTDAVLDTTKDEEIKSLKEQVRTLEIEKEILLKVIGK